MVAKQAVDCRNMVVTVKGCVIIKVWHVHTTVWVLKKYSERILTYYTRILLLDLTYGRTMHVDAAYCYRLSSVVCRSVTLVSPANTAESIDIPFGLRTLVGLRNHVLDGRPDPHGKGQFFWGEGPSHCKR